MEAISSTMWRCSTCKITGYIANNGWTHHLECEVGEVMAELGNFSTQKIDEAELAASMARHPAGKGKQSNQLVLGTPDRMKLYGVADYDFDGSDRLRSIFYNSIEDAVMAPDFYNGSIIVFDGLPPRMVDSHDVSMIELYELNEYLIDSPEMNEDNYMVFERSDEDNENMLTIVKTAEKGRSNG